MNKPFLISFLFLCSGMFNAVSAADPPEREAVFLSVKGTVTVQNGMGSVRRAHTGAKAYQGETIIVRRASKATLQLFDESTLELMANSRLTLATLHAFKEEKNIFMRLGFGKALVKVRQLFSAHSSFEIEAGGVVCGVRGTEFTMECDQKTGWMRLNVLDGVVAASSGGVTQLCPAGHECIFQNGRMIREGEGPGSLHKNPKGETGGNNNGTGQNQSGGPTTGNTGGGATSVVGAVGGNNNGNGQTQSGGPATGNTEGVTSVVGAVGGGPNATGQIQSGGATIENLAGGATSVVAAPGSGNATAPPGQGNAVPAVEPVIQPPVSPLNPQEQVITAPNLETNEALTDLNNQFTSGILVNNDNCLNSAQQTLNIHLVVPPKETVP